MSRTDSDSGLFEYDAEAGTDAEPPDPDHEDPLRLSDDDTVRCSVIGNDNGSGYTTHKVTIRKQILEATDIEDGDQLMMRPTDNGGFRCEPIDE